METGRFELAVRREFSLSLTDTEALGRATRRLRRHHREHASDTLDFEALFACGCGTRLFSDWLASERAPLAALEDPEGAAVDPGLPPVLDAHVHAFPDRVMLALWRWFEEHAWPIRYRLTAPELVRFQLDRGVSQVMLLCYAHKPELARPFNRFMAQLASDEPRALALGTVYPLAADVADVVREAFSAGLRGLKLHCHVQAFAPDDPRAEPMWQACEELDMPVLIHAGREPRSPAYPVDTYAVCDVTRIERVLRRHPRLRVCVPHMGSDEIAPYLSLLERHENLFLDTTMVLAGFFDQAIPKDVIAAHSSRLMYGTDFPNLPFAWDRELKVLTSLGLDEQALADVLSGNAERFLRRRSDATLP